MARILIAEDEPLITAFLEKGLRSQGYTVENVTKGEEIIEMALSENFDLLLLDLGLPVQEGWAIAFVTKKKNTGNYLRNL